MCESTVNVSSEHVGDGLDGVLPQGGDVSHQRLLMDGTNLCPVNLVQRVYQIHEGCEISREGREKVHIYVDSNTINLEIFVVKILL